MLKAVEKWSVTDVNIVEKLFPVPLISLVIYEPTLENSHINAIFVNDLFQFLLICKDTCGIYTTKKNLIDAHFVIVALDNKPILIAICGNTKMMALLYWMALVPVQSHI